MYRGVPTTLQVTPSLQGGVVRDPEYLIITSVSRCSHDMINRWALGNIPVIRALIQYPLQPALVESERPGLPR